MVGFARLKKLSILTLVASSILLVPIRGSAATESAEDRDDQARAFQTFIATSTTTERARNDGYNLNSNVIRPLVDGTSTGAQSTFSWQQLGDTENGNENANGQKVANRIKKLQESGWIVTNSDSFITSLQTTFIDAFKSIGIGALSVILMLNTVIASIVDTILKVVQALTFSSLIISTVSEKLGIHTDIQPPVSPIPLPDGLKDTIADIYVLIVGVGFLLTVGMLVLYVLNIARNKHRVYGKKALWGILTFITLPTMLVAIGTATQLTTTNSKISPGNFMKGLVVNTRGLALRGFSVDLPKGDYDPVTSSKATDAITGTWGANSNDEGNTDIPWATVVKQALTGNDNYYTAQAYLNDIVTKNISNNDGYDASASLPERRAYIAGFSKELLVDTEKWYTAGGGEAGYSEKNWGKPSGSNYAKLLMFLTGSTGDADAKLSDTARDQADNKKTAEENKKETDNSDGHPSATGANAAYTFITGKDSKKEAKKSTISDKQAETILSPRQLWLDRFIYLSSPIGSKEYYQSKPSPEQIFNVEKGGATSIDGKTVPLTVGSVFWLLQTKLDKQGGTVTSINMNPNGSAGAKQVRTADVAKWRSFTLATTNIIPLIMYVIGLTVISLIASYVAVVGLISRLPEMFTYGFKTWAGAYVQRSQDAYMKAVVVMAGSGFALVSVQAMPAMITELLQLIPKAVLQGLGTVQNGLNSVTVNGSGLAKSVGDLGMQAGMTILLAVIYLGIAYLLLFTPKGFKMLDTIIMFPWLFAKELAKRGSLTGAFNSETIKNATKSAERDRELRKQKSSERWQKLGAGAGALAGGALAVGTGGAGAGLASTGLKALKDGAKAKLGETGLGQGLIQAKEAFDENKPEEMEQQNTDQQKQDQDKTKNEQQDTALQQNKSAGNSKNNNADNITPPNETGGNSNESGDKQKDPETGGSGNTGLDMNSIKQGQADDTSGSQNDNNGGNKTPNSDSSEEAVKPPKSTADVQETGLNTDDTSTKGADITNNHTENHDNRTQETVEQHEGNTTHVTNEGDVHKAGDIENHTTNEGGITNHNAGDTVNNSTTNNKAGDTIDNSTTHTKAGDTIDNSTTHTKAGDTINNSTTNNKSGDVTNNNTTHAGDTINNTTNNQNMTTQHHIGKNSSSDITLENGEVERITKGVKKVIDDKTVVNRNDKPEK